MEGKNGKKGGVFKKHREPASPLGSPLSLLGRAGVEEPEQPAQGFQLPQSLSSGHLLG